MTYITLLSDFGLQDASVAIAKGTLMRHTPARKVLDISHEVTTFDKKQAAYLLASVYKKYPAGTCHILLLDIFSAPLPKLLLCEYDGHHFFTADNGILPAALQQPSINTWKVLELAAHQAFNDWLIAAADIISRLDKTKAHELGLEPYTPTENISSAKPQSDMLPCEIVHIDEFENVVLNITRQQFEHIAGNRRFRLEFMQVEEIDEVSGTYNDVRAGHKLCRFNSSGHLEICINRGKAASLFGLHQHNEHNDIKLIFE